MADIKFTGNLGRDAELKYTKNGSPVMRFSVADSKSRRLDNGEYETLAEQWLNCTIWGGLAEYYDGKLTKGARVTIYGEFFAREYEAKDGSKGTSLDVNVKGVDIFPSRNGGGQQRQAQASSGGGWGGDAGNGGGWGNGPDAGDPPF
ncbi:ssDNA-binding protein [Arthrobacter phage Jinkies]|uniref:Single-stranded DNA-binding protein n=1 Tax=Arthrobacter phage Jinkies TaxID=2743903 RepID=A0A7S5WYH9_9CAUD|nr:ssDNA-binding protein [Arthrobacter phage Jinkies]